MHTQEDGKKSSFSYIEITAIAAIVSLIMLMVITIVIESTTEKLKENGRLWHVGAEAFRVIRHDRMVMTQAKEEAVARALEQVKAAEEETHEANQLIEKLVAQSVRNNQEVYDEVHNFIERLKARQAEDAAEREACSHIIKSYMGQLKKVRPEQLPIGSDYIDYYSYKLHVTIHPTSTGGRQCDIKIARTPRQLAAGIQ